MRPDPELVKKLGTFGTATIHEASGQIGALPGNIKPVSQDMKLCGVVFPLHCLSRTNINLHHAIYEAEEGDVLVSSVDNFVEAGYWGDILTTAALQQGLSGIVIDACVRDADDIDELGFPVFSRGLNILGTGKMRGGSVGQSIIIGDVAIHAGDVIIGDRDGVVVIPGDRVAEVIEASQAREDKEEDVRNRLKSGETSLNIYKFP